MPDTIGDPARTPDLIIEKMSYDYDGFERGFGLWYTLSNFGLLIIDGKWHLRYNCPIANIAPQRADFMNDLVIDEKQDGIDNGSGGYNYPGFLAISIFRNGLPVFPVLKQTFKIYSTAYKLGYDWSKNMYYPIGFSYINAQGADMYVNKVQILEENGQPLNAKYLVAIEINPELKIREQRYDNNVSVLPIRIESGAAFVDESAINENPCRSAHELTAVYNGKGKNKTVTLSWHCPYHEPIYVKHWFTLKRDGIVIADNLKEGHYVDNVGGAWKYGVYEVVINVPGLGKSAPVSISVTK